MGFKAGDFITLLPSNLSTGWGTSKMSEVIEAIGVGPHEVHHVAGRDLIAIILRSGECYRFRTDRIALVPGPYDSFYRELLLEG